jgi:hypothetical protein
VNFGYFSKRLIVVLTQTAENVAELRWEEGQPRGGTCSPAPFPNPREVFLETELLMSRKTLQDLWPL